MIDIMRVTKAFFVCAVFLAGMTATAHAAPQAPVTFPDGWTVTAEPDEDGDIEWIAEPPGKKKREDIEISVSVMSMGELDIDLTTDKDAQKELNSVIREIKRVAGALKGKCDKDERTRVGNALLVTTSCVVDLGDPANGYKTTMVIALTKKSVILLTYIGDTPLYDKHLPAWNAVRSSLKLD